jgi:hypothetical protein
MLEYFKKLICCYRKRGRGRPARFRYFGVLK